MEKIIYLRDIERGKRKRTKDKLVSLLELYKKQRKLFIELFLTPTDNIIGITMKMMNNELPIKKGMEFIAIAKARNNEILEKIYIK